MRKTLLCFLAGLIFQNIAAAQWKRSDITKITYTSQFGGPYAYSNLIWLEVLPNGNMKMYNDTYVEESTIDKLLQHGSGTISVEQFKKIVVDDSLAYYADKISEQVYSEIVNKIVKMESDTSAGFFCCCDIPYQIITVHFKKEQKKFMRCDGRAKRSISDLEHYLNDLAYKPGYKIASTRFKVDRKFASP